MLCKICVIQVSKICVIQVSPAQHVPKNRFMQIPRGKYDLDVTDNKIHEHIVPE